MTPLVSIIIPTFNRAQYILAAVNSVLGQTWTTLELIVVDDGSTDNTDELVRQAIQDPRLRYVYQENQGRSAARNHGAKLAQGEFLGFLDSDDIYLPTAVDAHMEVFAKRPGLGLTVGGYQGVDEQGQFIGKREPWTEGGDLSLLGWLFNCYALPGAVLVRRNWFERTGGFDSNCEIAEDWDFFLQLARLGCPIEWTRQAVCQYRQHPGNSVHAVARHRDGAIRVMDKLFHQADIQPEVSALGKKAEAWVHVVFARKAYSVGEVALAVQDMGRAVQLDPDLAGSKKIELLEYLFSPAEDGSAQPLDPFSAVLDHLPQELKARPGEIRQALARVEMARFFQAVRRGAEAEAARHLRAGLRWNPGWLANRGVVAFCLKQALHKLG